jgi:hypothetical protein
MRAATHFAPAFDQCPRTSIGGAKDRVALQKQAVCHAPEHEWRTNKAAGAQLNCICRGQRAVGLEQMLSFWTGCGELGVCV